MQRVSVLIAACCLLCMSALTSVQAKDAGKRDPHAAAPSASASHSEQRGVSAEEALEMLKKGNARYVQDKASAPHRGASRRNSVARGQHPFAIILGCSDSRVPPEIIFDQGLGDLFIVRTAGNIADDIAVGSIEYAVEHLGVRLLLVLGHERCGAVDATVQGGDPGGHIKAIVDTIRPAVEEARSLPGELLENSIKANVKMVARQLKKSKPILKEYLEQRKLKIAGGYYDLDTGEVAVTYEPGRER